MSRSASDFTLYTKLVAEIQNKGGQTGLPITRDSYRNTYLYYSLRNLSPPPVPAPVTGNLPLTITSLYYPITVTTLPNNVYSLDMPASFPTQIVENIVPITTSLYTFHIVLPAVNDIPGDTANYIVDGIATLFGFVGISYVFTVNSVQHTYTPGDILTISLQDKTTGAIKVYLNGLLLDDTLSFSGTFPFYITLGNDTPNPLGDSTTWNIYATLTPRV